MDVEFFSFDKRRNSLKTPDAPGTVVQGVLKEPCSVLTPSVYFRFDPEQFTGDKYAYTYAEIPLFGRYYFVKNWTAEGGRWRCDMIVDVLASYRQSILDSTQYVERSASRKDGDVVDSLYPTKGGYSNTTVSIPQGALFKQTWGEGCYIVGISGGASNIGITYYKFTPKAFSDFTVWLSSDLTVTGFLKGLDISEISEGLQRLLVDPFSYIDSCNWIPFDAPVGSSVTYVQYGYWKYQPAGLSGVSIWNGAAITNTVTFNIPKHPNSSSDKYLRLAPYSVYELFFPPFGEIALDSLMLYDHDTLAIRLSIDIPTTNGHATLYLDDTNGAAVDHYSAKLGVSVPLSGRVAIAGQANLDRLVNNFFSEGIAENSADTARHLSMLAKVHLGLDGAPLVGNEFAHMFETVEGSRLSGLSQFTKLGSYGDITAYQQPIQLTLRYLERVETNNAKYGSPLAKVVKLSTLSGFCKCQSANLTLLGGLYEEVSTATSYLNMGVYIE